MCTRTTCPRCGKPTYVGCGRHVEKVLRDVPVEQRCACKNKSSDTSVEDSSGALSAGGSEHGGFFSRLFGR